MSDATKRLLLHLPVGALTAWLLGQALGLGAIFFVAFMIYELSEDWRIRDLSYKDIAGFLWGFAIAAVLICVL